MWAEKFTNVRPIFIAHEEFDNGDMGFKLIEKENYTNERERLNQVPYVFKRSDIAKRIAASPPRTLYLTNENRKENYQIALKDAENLGYFMKLFPKDLYSYVERDSRYSY